jgi:hypothetical protein
MRLRDIWVLIVPVLAGCHTVDDVRQQPVEWSATYAVAFDAMANCLAVQSARDFDVTPQLYQSQRRAIVTLGVKGSYSLLAEYQVRQVSDGETEVNWRTVSSLASTPLARDRANRCARVAMADVPRPAPPSATPQPPAWAPQGTTDTPVRQ